LAQYYVLPWVITNYGGKNGFSEFNELFIEDKRNMRDLTFPTGKLGE
jgi:hypothetical protein